jgi:hypothetical protein
MEIREGFQIFVMMKFVRKRKVLLEKRIFGQTRLKRWFTFPSFLLARLNSKGERNPAGNATFVDCRTCSLASVSSFVKVGKKSSAEEVINTPASMKNRIPETSALRRFNLTPRPYI